MNIRSLVEAHQLIGHRVRYMRRGGSRFGWEGVIDYANTQKVRVVWDRPDGDYLTQEYQVSSLYRENGEDDNGTTYILILTDESDDKGSIESQRPQEISFAETGRQIERFGKLLQNPQVRLNELAWEARKAGFNLRISIQPKGEVTTNGDAETP